MDDFSACAWCATVVPSESMETTQHGLCCPQCVRIAQAEQMRANDLRPRTRDPESTQLHQLCERLRLACQVTTPPQAADYPQACVAATASLEAVVRELDVAEVVYCASADAASRDDFEAAASKTIEDLIWLIRWQTKELAHSGRQVSRAREPRLQLVSRTSEES